MKITESMKYLKMLRRFERGKLERKPLFLKFPTGSSRQKMLDFILLKRWVRHRPPTTNAESKNTKLREFNDFIQTHPGEYPVGVYKNIMMDEHPNEYEITELGLEQLAKLESTYYQHCINRNIFICTVVIAISSVLSAVAAIISIFTFWRL
jgi:hypothetical protein